MTNVFPDPDLFSYIINFVHLVVFATYVSLHFYSSYFFKIPFNYNACLVYVHEFFILFQDPGDLSKGKTVTIICITLSVF